jgi:hypothetical protein
VKEVRKRRKEGEGMKNVKEGRTVEERRTVEEGRTVKEGRM